MRISFLATVLCVLTHTLSAQQYKGNSWSQVKAAGAGTLAVVYYEQPGLIYKSEDGKIKGVCVDILSDFAAYVKEKHGKTVNVSYVGREEEFAKFLKIASSTPNVLGVTNTTITEERKKTMQFSPPFMSTEPVLLTHRNAPALRSLNDLSTVYKGFSAEVITGTTHEKLIAKIKQQYYPDLTISFAPSSESVIEHLNVNPKLFSILDFTEYIGVVRKKIPLKRQEVQLGNSEPLGFVMSKQSDWAPLFNEFLTEDFRKSVRYKQIIAENLGSSFLSLVR